MKEESKIIIKNYDDAIIHINKTINGLDSQGNKTLNLCNCDFTEFVNMSNQDNTFYFRELFVLLGIIDNLNEKSCEVDYNVFCWNSIFLNTDISLITFNKGVSFMDSKFKEKIVISNCKFKHSTVNFSSSTFEKGIAFNFNSFEKDAYVIFQFAQFNLDSYFMGIPELHESVFNPILDFSNVKFENCNIYILGVYATLYLSDCIIKDDCIIKIDSNLIGELILSQSIINGDILLKVKNISMIFADFTHITGSILFSDNLKVSNVGNRYTARLLKNECIKRNDIVLSHYFKMIEMKKHFNEIIKLEVLKKNKVLSCILKYEAPTFLIKSYEMLNFCVKAFNRLFEILLLLLNKASNNHGLSWFRGVVFTVSMSFVFYTLFYSFNQDLVLCNPFDSSCIYLNKDYFNEVLRYLWLVDTSGTKEVFENNSKGVFIFILGKIFIAYGIYQTISAFRKYSLGKA